MATPCVPQKEELSRLMKQEVARLHSEQARRDKEAARLTTEAARLTAQVAEVRSAMTAEREQHGKVQERLARHIGRLERELNRLRPGTKAQLREQLGTAESRLRMIAGLRAAINRRPADWHLAFQAASIAERYFEEAPVKSA